MQSEYERKRSPSLCGPPTPQAAWVPQEHAGGLDGPR
jgi:hypothetical protein